MNGLANGNLLFLTIAVAVTSLAMLVFLLLVYFIKQNQNAMRYSFELQRAVLSSDREFYERQLAKAALQMTSAEDRWRDANHLLLSEKNLSGPQTGRPDSRDFLTKFGIEKVEIDPRLVMVLTPFSDEESDTFRVIKETYSRIGLNVVRGDEQFIQGDILAYVVRLIISARLIIANISTRNANVFYELGIAHAVNKPTILVSRSLNDAPFDIKSNRIIVYRNDDELRSMLTESLARGINDGNPLRPRFRSHEASSRLRFG